MTEPRGRPFQSYVCMSNDFRAWRVSWGPHATPPASSFEPLGKLGPMLATAMHPVDQHNRHRRAWLWLWRASLSRWLFGHGDAHVAGRRIAHMSRRVIFINKKEFGRGPRIRSWRGTPIARGNTTPSDNYDRQNSPTAPVGRFASHWPPRSRSPRRM